MAAHLHRAQSLLPPQIHHPLILSDQFRQEGTTASSSSSGSNSESGPTSPSSASGNRGGDEDDIEMDDGFTAELTRRMAHYMLQEEDDDRLPRPSIGLSALPQQCQESWGPADVSISPHSPFWSPPVTPPVESEMERAGEVLPYHLINRFKKMEVSATRGLERPDSYSLRTKAPPKPASRKYNPNLVHHSNRAILEDIELRGPPQFNLPMPAKTEQRTSGRSHLQHQLNHQVSGSGMQAVFLSKWGSGSRSCGTGVFLPRGAGSSAESRKKPRCSTVLIPARVAQALMTHFERMNSQPRASIDGRLGGLKFQQKSQSQAAPALNNNDTGLPHEWIY
ncbi:uncharacterized protein LOC116211126 [Punica granatum]|uniref:Uncharacterized protein LOC116211126 n=1 Tax=Punica granatum TaxID=22663 RepID=A0A6P8DUV2_PUNGR|nr:uncharacterized protein LOC116211126 [Punica granatum]